jgi:hypothetical protein
MSVKLTVNNEDRKIAFGGNAYDIGACLLSFLDLDLAVFDNEHPYIKNFKASKKTLAEMQAQYKDAVINCLYVPHYQKETAPVKPSRGITATQANRGIIPPVSLLFDSKLNDNPKTVTLQYRAEDTPDGKGRLDEIFDAPDLSTACYIEFMKMIQYGINVRKCQNCKLFFIPTGGYDFRYCERVPQGETRSCQQMGAINTFKAKIADNPILAEHGKIYRRYHSRKRNGLITAEQFTAWGERAREVRDKAIQDNLTLQQFIEAMEGISIQIR